MIYNVWPVYCTVAVPTDSFIRSACAHTLFRSFVWLTWSSSACVRARTITKFQEFYFEFLPTNRSLVDSSLRSRSFATTMMARAIGTHSVEMPRQEIEKQRYDTLMICRSVTKRLTVEPLNELEYIRRQNDGAHRHWMNNLRIVIHSHAHTHTRSRAHSAYIDHSAIPIGSAECCWTRCCCMHLSKNAKFFNGLHSKVMCCTCGVQNHGENTHIHTGDDHLWTKDQKRIHDLHTHTHTHSARVFWCARRTLQYRVCKWINPEIELKKECSKTKKWKMKCVAILFQFRLFYCSITVCAQSAW